MPVTTIYLILMENGEPKSVIADGPDVPIGIYDTGTGDFSTFDELVPLEDAPENVQEFIMNMKTNWKLTQKFRR